MSDQPPQPTNSEAQVKNDGDPFTPPPLGDYSVPSSAESIGAMEPPALLMGGATIALDGPSSPAATVLEVPYNTMAALFFIY